MSISGGLAVRDDQTAASIESESLRRNCRSVGEQELGRRDTSLPVWNESSHLARSANQRCSAICKREQAGATICVVTAKEQLLARVRGLSEAEAADTLRLLDERQQPLDRRLDDAPAEDEQISPQEEAAVQEARDQLSAGAPVISHEEIKSEFGIK